MAFIADLPKVVYRPLMHLRSAVRKLAFMDGLPRIGRWSDGKTLLRGSHFARYCAGWIFSAFDWVEGLACSAIEKIHESLLAGLRYGLNLFAIALQGEQNWRGWKITIPKIMFDTLKVPNPPSGFSIQGDKTIREQIIAESIRTIEIKCR